MEFQRILFPAMFAVDIIYTLIIVILCTAIYIKTREIYSLTKHKGIKYFRNAFLFLGMSYASSIFLYLIMIGSITLDFGPETLGLARIILPLSNLIVAYLSTMALLYLTYSTIWKKIEYRRFLIFSHAFAAVTSIIAFLTQNPLIIFLAHLILLILAVVFSLVTKSAMTKTRIFYLLIFFFWLINIFSAGPRRFIPFEIRIIIQIASIVVFAIIYYKVNKWTK